MVIKIYVFNCWKCGKVRSTTYPRGLDASIREERGECHCKKFEGGVGIKRTLEELKYYCKDCECYYWERRPTEGYKRGKIYCRGGIVCPVEEERKKLKRQKGKRKKTVLEGSFWENQES